MLSQSPRPGLPPIPSRMRGLPLDARGYPVPWFVQWIDGKPDFRVMDSGKWVRAVRFGNCWLCGEPVGKLRTYAIGPMCAISRTTSEPGSHEDCAQFAAKACPFMTLPAAQYRRANLPENHRPAPGVLIDRNPGCVCLWTTISFSTFRTGGVIGNAGRLIHLGEPRRVEWYAEGRRATREQVLDSVESGYPILLEAAQREGAQSVDELVAMRGIFSKWLPEVAR